jgi:hypothetical protein
MATRGLADFLRAASVLVRGIIVNFLVFLPYLLAVAIMLAFAHNWLLAHPYRLTLGVLALAAAWILIFPAFIPLFEIVTYKRSVESGSASTVKQRDRYERSFGTLLLAVFSVAALESLPRALVYLHDLIHLQHFGWKGLATVSVGLAFFSSASKLLSVLGGLKKKVAMVLIGILGLITPLIVILYAMDFLVYSLPPSPLVMYSPLVVPVIGVIGIALAIPLGLRQRAFTRKELYAVVGLLVAGSALLVTVIVVSRQAIGTAKERDDLLDRDLKPIAEIADQSESIAKRQEMAPEVAALFDAFVRTDRESKSILSSPRQKQIQEELEDFAKSAACSDYAQRFDSPANLFRRFRDCLRLDELQAEWDRPYFTKGLQLVLLGHKLSEQPDENLAPLRREFTRLAQGQLLEQMKENDKDDGKVAGMLRGALVERYLSSSPSLEEAIGHAKAALSRSAAEDIAILAGADKFETLPGRAPTARLVQEVVEEFNAPIHRRWLSKADLPAGALAAKAELAAREKPEVAEISRRCLAFFYSTRALRSNDQQEVPMEEAEARAAGERLAKRALQNLPVDSLKVLAFELGDYDAGELEKDYEKAKQNEHNADELKSFLNDLEKQPLKDLARDHLSISISKGDGPKEGELLYQWRGEYRFTLLLAGKALGNDTDALARLARENLIERALAPDTRVGERQTILRIFGESRKEVYGNEELARVAIARWFGEPARAEDLIRTMMFGSLGTLERSGLAKVGEQVTRDVMLPKVIFVSLFAVVIWLLWWLAVDINLTSVHGLYRDRLAAAFLVGKDTKGDIGIEEDIDLDDICLYEARSTAPYHLINVALNLQGSKDPDIRDRRSDFFIFSRRFTGGAHTGYCRSVSMKQVFPQMDVATAMAISAAAASPNMGRATSPLLVAFMTLLNIRLGYWVPNPGILEEKLNEALRERRKKDPTQPPGFTFEEVFAEELREIESRWGQVYRQGPRRRIANREESDPTVAHELAGIGFSGGGIRSAAFNLGVTQALHRSGAFDHLDYMSTVSGGGYLGSSISTLMRTREKTKSEIDGTVTISRTEDEQMVTVTSKDGEERRTYRFSSGANLSVRDGQNILAKTPLLNPNRGRSDIAGQVAVDENPPEGGYKVKVQGVPSDGHRDYWFSKWESLAVKPGDRVKKGDKLIQRYDTLSDRFHWRVRPTAYLREMLSKLDEKHRWVNLSDGGHIENLAAIELLRRRCRYIIIGDGEGDPQLHFGGLATFMRYAQIDLGIRIKIELGPIRLSKPKQDNEGVDVSGAHWAFGKITYPRKDGNEEPEEGYLLYLKSSFTADEDEMICEYRHRNPAFPHQSTADQFFGEDQFEAYRALGQHIAEDALHAWTPANPALKMSFDDFKDWFDRLEKKQGESKTQTTESRAS